MKKNRDGDGLQSRKNELSPILHRNAYEEMPPDTNKKDWDEFRMKYNSAANLELQDNPIQLNLGLSMNCNLKCGFCIQGITDHSKMYYNKVKKSPGGSKMGFDAYKKIIDEAVSFGVKSVKLNSIDEPLLNKDIASYIIYAKSAGIINIYFSTNGILLTDEMAKSLIDSGLTKIQISIDSITKETYQKQRNSGKYETIVSNVLGFIDRRNAMGRKFPLVRVSFLQTRMNIHEMQKFIDFWEGKADIIGLQEMNELPEGESDYFIGGGIKSFRCAFPFKQLKVDATGSIHPCCAMNGINMKLGDIQDISLKDAWNSPQMKDLQGLHKYGDYKKNPHCNKCINGI
jgi:radical SAM protein with 4Fe4S-binding SPASM domain